MLKKYIESTQSVHPFFQEFTNTYPTFNSSIQQIEEFLEYIGLEKDDVTKSADGTIESRLTNKTERYKLVNIVDKVELVIKKGDETSKDLIAHFVLSMFERHFQSPRGYICSNGARMLRKWKQIDGMEHYYQQHLSKQLIEQIEGDKLRISKSIFSFL